MFDNEFALFFLVNCWYISGCAISLNFFNASGTPTVEFNPSEFIFPSIYNLRIYKITAVQLSAQIYGYNRSAIFNLGNSAAENDLEEVKLLRTVLSKDVISGAP